jgi:TPP-dependent pyruvate/acetoin dehydrogenase alpha subunit
MPRSKIDLPYTVEHLSILNERVKWTRVLSRIFLRIFLLKLHRAMLLGRRFDERLLSLQRQAASAFAPITGQKRLSWEELQPASSIISCPSFRETAAQIYRGAPMRPSSSFWGYNEGLFSSKKGMISLSQFLFHPRSHAVGIAWGIKYRGKKDVAMTFFGDGGTSQGDFHEGMNFAGVYQIPVVFVCQNNHWAISVPRSRQTHSKTIAQKAIAYDIPGFRWTAMTSWRFTRRKGSCGQGEIRRRAFPDRMCHLPHDDAHHG